MNSNSERERASEIRPGEVDLRVSVPALSSTTGNNPQTLYRVSGVSENNTNTNPGSGSTSLFTLVCSVYKKFRELFDEREGWVKENQEALMVVATLIATMSFQVASNPPGGIWQQDYNQTSAAACIDFNHCRAGTAVLAANHPAAYLLIMICNALSFVASLSFVLLALSGLPLKNKFCTWLLTIAMICAITFTVATYLVATWSVAPRINRLTITVVWALIALFWVGLAGFIAMFIVIRILLWLLNWIGEILRRPRAKNHQRSCITV